jgi:hypothetical protein
LVTVREASGAALSRAHYLLGYAERFKVSQEFILAAAASRMIIHVGKRPTVRVLDTKAAWNLYQLPRRRERARDAHSSKAIWAPGICHPEGILSGRLIAPHRFGPSPRRDSGKPARGPVYILGFAMVANRISSTWRFCHTSPMKGPLYRDPSLSFPLGWGFPFKPCAEKIGDGGGPVGFRGILPHGRADTGLGIAIGAPINACRDAISRNWRSRMNSRLKCLM